MFKPCVVVICAAYCFAASVAAQRVQILPAAPRYMEPVYARIFPDVFSGGQRAYGAKVSMAGNVISVLLFLPPPDIGVYDNYDVELGRLPSGTYTVQLVGSSSPSAQFTVAEAATPPNPQFSQLPAVPAVNYSDIWWNPSESGWGLTIVQGPTNVLFAVWFVYDASGEPTWYTLEPGQATSAGLVTTFTGPIYKTNGPYFGGPFDPAQVGTTQAGTGTLQFRHSDSGTFSYTVEGVTGSKAIVRQPIE
jgi:hypothetical protein